MTTASLCCKANRWHSGKTALQWIEEYTVADIGYHLRSTDYSVKEIADKLGFPNASFFGKYVKQKLGCPPLAYRRKMRKD